MHFSAAGAFTTFFAYYMISGKQEIQQTYLVYTRYSPPSLSKDPMTESIGRSLALMTQAVLAIIAGGLMENIVFAAKTKAYDDDPNTRWYARLFVWAWAGLMLASWSALAGRVPHTTWFTRACVAVVEKARGRHRDGEGKTE